MPQLEQIMTSISLLRVRQKRELAELFGFETRNKYAISDEAGQELLYAAEQQKGMLGFLVRQVLGHWRSFEVHFFTTDRKPLMIARHPFRWFFQRLEVTFQDGRPLGALQQRFAILSKRFDVVDAMGRTILTVNSPLWKPWTFPFAQNGQDLAYVRKRWSGLVKEALLDADNFRIELHPSLPPSLKLLVVAAAIFIDLQYFERKAD